MRMGPRAPRVRRRVIGILNREGLEGGCEALLPCVLRKFLLRSKLAISPSRLHSSETNGAGNASTGHCEVRRSSAHATHRAIVVPASQTPTSHAAEQRTACEDNRTCPPSASQHTLAGQCRAHVCRRFHTEISSHAEIPSWSIWRSTQAYFPFYPSESPTTAMFPATRLMRACM